MLLLLLFLPLFDFKSQTRQTKLIIVVVTSKCIVVVKKGCCNLWPLNFVVLNSTHVSFFFSYFFRLLLLFLLCVVRYYTGGTGDGCWW